MVLIRPIRHRPVRVLIESKKRASHGVEVFDDICWEPVCQVCNISGSVAERPGPFCRIALCQNELDVWVFNIGLYSARTEVAWEFDYALYFVKMDSGP